MQVYDGPQWMWKLRLQFFSSHWAILDLIGKTEYRWIVRFKRSTQHHVIQVPKGILKIDIRCGHGLGGCRGIISAGLFSPVLVAGINLECNAPWLALFV